MGQTIRLIVTVLGRIADLLSGRVHNTLHNLQRFRQEMIDYMQQQNAIEQRLRDLNSRLQNAVSVAQGLSTNQQALREALEYARSQAAQSPPGQPQGQGDPFSVLEDELNALDTTVAQMQDALSGAQASDTGLGRGQGQNPTPAVEPPSPQAPVAPVPGQPDSITGMQQPPQAQPSQGQGGAGESVLDNQSAGSQEASVLDQGQGFADTTSTLGREGVILEDNK